LPPYVGIGKSVVGLGLLTRPPLTLTSLPEEGGGIQGDYYRFRL